MQYSKSLSSLPQRRETGEQSEHAKLRRTRGPSGEISARQRVQFSLHPHLIYSDETEDSQPSNHPKLIRQSNVLAGLDPVVRKRNREEESEDSPSPSVTLEGGEEAGLEADDAGLQQEGRDYYKTMKTGGGEDIYSYAYRDAFSPAALIKLEDRSDVSEDIYDSIKAPSELSKVEVMSDSLSEPGDLFLSIR